MDNNRLQYGWYTRLEDRRKRQRIIDTILNVMVLILFLIIGFAVYVLLNHA